MGHYIFLTGLYLPKPGATGMCVHAVAKELTNRGHIVKVICYDNKEEKKHESEIETIRVHVPFFLKHHYSIFKQKLAYCISLVCKFLHIINYPLRSSSLVKNYYSALEKAYKEYGGDKNSPKIIASFTPFEAVFAGYKFKLKHPNSKLYYYSTDTLSNEGGKSRFLPIKTRNKLGLKWEKRFFDVYDVLIIMNCHKQYYYSDKFASYINKMRLSNFPLFRPNSYKKTSPNLNIVYAGTLYKRIRNPRYACTVLTELVKKTDFTVFFLGSGDCDEILKETEKISDGRIKNLGMQDYGIAQSYLSQAMVLLSIGNFGTDMTPSKIYEYISTGKPIIHFYSCDNDLCLEPLNLYGNCLLVKEGNANVDEVIRFCKKANQIPLEQFKDNFVNSTPSFTADIIEHDNL